MAVSSRARSSPPRPRKAGLASGENSEEKEILPQFGCATSGAPTSACALGWWWGGSGAEGGAARGRRAESRETSLPKAVLRLADRGSRTCL